MWLLSCENNNCNESLQNWLWSGNEKRLIEVNEKENHTKEKMLEERKEREGPEIALACCHTEPLALIF